MSRPPGPDGPQPTPIASELEPAFRAQWMADRLIGIQDIRILFGLGRTAAYELTHRPGFPKAVVISPRCYRWWASEVMDFAASIQRPSAEPRQPFDTTRIPERSAPDPSAPPRRITGSVRLAHARRKRHDGSRCI